MDKKKKATKKSLQKCTKLIPKAELQELIDSNNESELIRLKEELMNQIQMSLEKVILKEKEPIEQGKIVTQYENEVERLFMILDSNKIETNPQQNERLRRITFDINRGVILAKIHEIVKDHGKLPNQTELAECTGLSRTTIIKHLSEISTNQMYDEVRFTSALLLPTVMAMVYKLAMAGDVKALKTFLDFHKQGPNTTFIKNQQNNINATNEEVKQKNVVQVILKGVENKTMEG
jgi:hypothetical protein